MAGLLGVAPNPLFATTAAAVMVNGNTIFTVSGPILILGLVSTCVTANDGTGSTLQYSVTPTVGAGAQTISAASSALTSAAAGATVSLIGTALSTAASLNANGPNLSMTAPIYCPAGIITVVIGVGSTTGTWKHTICYWPLAGNSTAS